MKTDKPKEIGGYLGLESFRGREYYPGLYRLNLGRTALVWLLQRIRHRRVFIPSYICSSVIHSAEQAGFDVVTYGLDEALNPVWTESGSPEPDDILYLVNYYGQLSPDEIASYRDAYPCVIVDNAQAFYDRPVEGVHTLYSARKFFGVSDGAYLATDIDVSSDDIPADRSTDRLGYLAGRTEDGARAHYSGMLAVSDSFADEIPRRMSLLTANFLKAVDYSYVRDKRRENYMALSSLLPDDNPFLKRMPECPFAYPYRHENGVALRKHLAENNVFVPTNWTYLLTDMPADSLEYQWSSDILPLPVDQRCGEEDMRRIADLILGYE